MKHKVTTIALVGALTLGGASAAYAQGTSPTTAVPTVAPRATTGTSGSTVGTTGSTAGVNTTQAPADNDGMDWGWIGLVGLAGLAPLFMRRRRDDDVHVTHVNTDDSRVRRVA